MMVQQFTLSDERKLDFVVAGDPKATPLVHFHGMPGSYVITPGIPEACKKYGLSIVSFSRPGYSASTRQKGRAVIDTLNDVHELLKHLGHTRYYAAGWSGGGPYALAAAASPDCIAAFTIASLAPHDAEGLDWLAGFGQFNIDQFNAEDKGEPALRTYIAPLAEAMRTMDAAATAQGMASLLPDVDKKVVLEDQDMAAFFSNTAQTGLKLGDDGWVDDNHAFKHPWGFSVKDIRAPVFLYQGKLDAMVPFGHGEWLASHVPGVVPHLELDQGHMSISAGRADKLVKELVDASA